ncbi:hypothetical protein JL720_9014 [Aureococcus anophagefferens]|nr:hypothetical protein JL720_9014 [Aureococcus anophagefferens]
MLKLGYLYDNGDGVKLDKKKAEQLYRMAADKGAADEGFVEARRWLDRAAAKGDEDASRGSQLISKLSGRPIVRVGARAPG